MMQHSTVQLAPVVHSHPRDVHGRFVPEHRQSFPTRRKNETRNGVAAPIRAGFPDTGTPDALLSAHRDEPEFERSERVAAGEEIIPSDDDTELIESVSNDWLDADASQ